MREVVPVETAADLEHFIELPYQLHAGEPHWVAPLRRDERRRFSARHNPFLAHAVLRQWLAVENGRVTGRVAAIDDQLHNETHREAVTWFGFFEAVDAPTAQALLAAVEGHAATRGSTEVRGPVNPSLNECAGLLIDRFDDDPYVLMPYNPPSYPGFIEGAGYRKVRDLLAWRLDLADPLPARIERLATRTAKRAGVAVRTVDLRAYDRDLAILQSIYTAAWQDNWGFVPPTDAEMRQLALDLRSVLDPNLVLFAEAHGEPIGCAVAIPDLNQLLKRMRGRMLPFGILQVLRRKRLISRVRALLLGVLPQRRRQGLYPLLIAELFRRGRAAGYREAELSWTLEDNDAVNAGIGAVGGRRHKTYRLYGKPIG